MGFFHKLYHPPVFQGSLKKKNYRLDVQATHVSPGTLRAPVLGNMSRSIKESIDSQVSITLSSKNKTIYTGKSLCAGFEISGDILGSPAENQK